MREFVIMADSDSELPYRYADEHQIPVFLMPYTIDGKEELFDLGRNTDFKRFYTRLREGAEASTATRPPQDIQDFFESVLKEGKDIIYICFSSQLSAHHSLSVTAREAALQNYPEAKITIVDTLAISQGVNLLIQHAVRMHEGGSSYDEIVTWLEENKKRVLHFFSVDSLSHLRRTGRLSAVTATLGTILDLKPILTLNKEGKIIAYEKVKGRKKVAKYLLDQVEKYWDRDDPACRELCIVLHADAEETARQIETEIRARFDFEEIWFYDVGPVIGCHCGPGTLAVLFMGKDRVI